MALAMLECGPPTEHRSGAEMRLLADGTYHLAVGSTEMGNGSVTSHRQLAAGVLGCRASQVDIINADTDRSTVRHWHLRQHRHRGGRPGGGTDRGGAAREHPGLRPPAHRSRASPPASWRRRACSAATIGSRCRAVCRRARDGHRFIAGAGRISRRAPSRSTCTAFAWRCTGDRRNPHPAQRARRRYRPADQSDAVPRPDRRRHRHGDRLGADREHGARRRRQVVNPNLRNYRIPAFADSPPVK